MVRRRGSQSAQWRSSPFNAVALALPFIDRAWEVVAQTGACVVAMTGVLSAWRPTPVFGGVERGGHLRRLKLAALQWVLNLYVCAEGGRRGRGGGLRGRPEGGLLRGDLLGRGYSAVRWGRWSRVSGKFVVPTGCPAWWAEEDCLSDTLAAPLCL